MPKAKARSLSAQGAANAVRESDELRLFRTALDASADMIVLVDRASMRFIDANDSACRLLGYSREELLARGPQDVLPFTRAELERAYDELIAGEALQTGLQSYYRCRDGSQLPFEASRRAVRSGERWIVVAISRDIRRRLAAEAAMRESDERFRRIFELAGVGVAIIGLDRRFMRVNRRLTEIFGRAENEIIGRTAREFSHPDDLDIINPQRPRLYSGEIEAVRGEKRYVRKDGGVVWTAYTIVVERDAAGKALYEIGFFDDITARKTMEAALKESEERFRHTFELAASGIAHVSLDGKFTRANRTLCEILGYPESQLVGLSVKDVSYREDRDVTDSQRARVRSGEVPSAHFEKRYVRGDGGIVWVDLTVALVRGADGKPQYEIAIFDDITERKNAERALRMSEARFRSLTQLSSDWYWEQDREFRLTFMSARMGDRTGLDPSAYLGRKRWDSPALNLSEEDWRRHREQLERHEPFRDFEMARPLPDGSSRWVSLSGEPLFDEDGAFLGYRGVGKDITERREAEAELRRAHADLEKKAEELQRSNSELEQFAYVASHDLQEPLRMVSSYTQLVLRRYGERLDGDAKEFMAYVVDGAARMKQLIEDLLAYSRVGTRGKEFKPVPVENALRRAINNLRAAIEEAGASVTYDSLPTVNADDGQLAQLFQNLIGNALKFRSASVPRIHVSAEQNEHEWEFGVQDNGIGIEAAYFERIFMVFQQLHTKGEYPGTGIGLAICKKVVERHGGRIWVDSRPGEGSTFHFTLPQATETAQ